MRVDFYQLSHDPAEQVVPLLARKVLAAGQRMLVVSDDPAQREAISRGLWEQGGAHFLANGEAPGPHAARQPILLSQTCEAPNEARMIVLADGRWREEASGFERAFLLFDAGATQAARDLWREFRKREGVESHAWKQDGNRWIEVG